MGQRRTEARQKSFLQGRVFFNEGHSSLDCVVRDLSETGARLKFTDPVTTPDLVELNIPVKGETCAVEVKWRNAHEMGVAFVRPHERSEPPAAVAAEAAAKALAPPEPDLKLRVDRLEREVAALSRTMHELRVQLRRARGDTH